MIKQTLLIEETTAHSPFSLAHALAGVPGRVLLHSADPSGTGGRYSFVTAAPFLTFRNRGAACRIRTARRTVRQFGNPWSILASLFARYELLDEIDLPFPLGGAFGFWGYELRSFVEPRLPRHAADDLGLPDCHLGFYNSLVVFDHALAKCWIVATGQQADGRRCANAAAAAMEFWRTQLRAPLRSSPPPRGPQPSVGSLECHSSLGRAAFIERVERGQRYIRAGDIYQVNLAQRLRVGGTWDAAALYEALAIASPAPFAAWIEAGPLQLLSSSPELFLRFSGREVITRPIKGTRPRGVAADRDIQLAYELQTSPKEMAELVMITDLLRNDLGRVCEYGSIQVPELARLERYAYVQHLVSTVVGRLREDVSHLAALQACFPGGSVTGAPKVRAMEIIEELEPVPRGPYTGCLGYLGFNRESQLAIIIRTALRTRAAVHFHVGAGIVADSDPAAEYEETVDKARGFLAAIGRLPGVTRVAVTPPSFPEWSRRSHPTGAD